MTKLTDVLLPAEIKAILATDRTGQALFSSAVFMFANAELAREEGQTDNHRQHMSRVAMAIGVLSSVHPQGADRLASSAWWLDQMKLAVGTDATRIVSAYASGMPEF